MATAKKTESTPAPDKRDDSTDQTVTELAHVDATTKLGDMKEMSGATDADASTQQKNALDGMKDARDDAKHPEREPAAANPFSAGPGSDVA